MLSPYACLRGRHAALVADPIDKKPRLYTWHTNTVLSPIEQTYPEEGHIFELHKPEGALCKLQSKTKTDLSQLAKQRSNDGCSI